MKFLRRIAPLAVIAAAAILILFLPDRSPERYTDLATFFRVEMKRQAYHGYAVAAVAKGSVLYVDAFGVDGAGKALTPDSPMFIGAPSMSMAATAALSLDQDRKLDLDQPVRKYLPWFCFADGSGGDVTLRHLVSHTSGVSDATFDDSHERAPNLDAAARSLLRAHPVDAPGTTLRYLVTDYQALGLVMEKAAGKKYPELVAERVFAPLGMKRSTARPEGLGVAVPLGSACFFGAALPRAVSIPPYGAPSTTVVSTAADLGSYLAFLVAPEKLRRPPLAPTVARSLLEPAVPGIKYGFGWYLEGEGQSRTASHDGSVEGFSSRLVLWPELKAGIAVVAAQNSLLQSMIAMPALIDGAKRIMLEGSAERPFPLERLYMLLGVVAVVHVFTLALQTGGALGYAKEVRDRAEARGVAGPMIFAGFRLSLGIVLRILIVLAVPRLVSLCFGRTVTWKIAFALEPGIAAWIVSACFFGILRDIARLAWLRGATAFRRVR